MVLNKIKSICIIKKKGAIIVMEKAKFLENLINKAKQINVVITEEKANRFYEYNNLLLEWNEKINLTAITDEREIILKHFIDSLTINRYIGNAETVMDIGTGAGFPGIPLKIVNENKSFILVDALNKRINFLEEVKNNLKLNDLDLIHSRSEDLAKDLNYRENMDIVTSRAVANLRVLVEYMLPFVKLNGLCICMKGPNVKEEIAEAENAINILGGKIEKVDKIILPESEIERNIIVIKKINKTPSKYPRKAGTATKQPL